MKKVIVAAAGLMLAGTMVSSAVAKEPGVTFGGDARARWYYQEDYKDTGSKDNFLNSRVRLKWTAVAKGGAYAVARFRLADAKWDGTQATRALGEGSNLYTDYAYIGVPMGPVTAEAGLMPRNITEFFEWDTRVDSLQFKYVADNTIVIPFYEKVDEYEGDEEGNVLDSDANDDNDVDRYGIWLSQKFGDGWDFTGALTMVDNQQTEVEGFGATGRVMGTVGGVALGGELSFKESDLVGGDDDGIGGWLSADFMVGSASVGGLIGFTQDGFIADGDFGPFIMLSDVTQIATTVLIGAGGDTFFGSLYSDFKATERLTLGAEIGYADIDTGDNTEDETAFEIGATASYAISDGAKLNAVIGFLDYDTSDYDPFGLGLSLEISY